MIVPTGPFDTEAQARAAAQAAADPSFMPITAAATLALSLPQPRDGGRDA
jgi:hypothetical protein